MSLLNVWYSAHRVVVAVDTATGAMDARERTHSSKLVPLVHANVVLAGRGTTGFLPLVYASCHMGGGACDFDSLSDGMIPLLDRTLEYAIGLSQDHGITDEFVRYQEVLLAGWSTRRNAMAAMIYAPADDDSGFEELDANGWTTPWNDDWGEVPENAPDGLSGIEALARRQVAFCRAAQPGAPIGGDLLIASLTRDSFTVGKRCCLTALPHAK